LKIFTENQSALESSIACPTCCPLQHCFTVTVASSNPIFDTIYTTSRTLFGAEAANNLSAALTQASRTFESFFLHNSSSPADQSYAWHENFYEHLNDFPSARPQLENTSLLLAICTFL